MTAQTLPVSGDFLRFTEAVPPPRTRTEPLAISLLIDLPNRIGRQSQPLTAEIETLRLQKEKQQNKIEILRADNRRLRIRISKLESALQEALTEKDVARQSNIEFAAALHESEQALQAAKAEATAIQEFKKTERSDGQSQIHPSPNL